MHIYRIDKQIDIYIYQLDRQIYIYIFECVCPYIWISIRSASPRWVAAKDVFESGLPHSLTRTLCVCLHHCVFLLPHPREFGVERLWFGCGKLYCLWREGKIWDSFPYCLEWNMEYSKEKVLSLIKEKDNVEQNIKEYWDILKTVRISFVYLLLHHDW